MNNGWDWINEFNIDSPSGEVLDYASNGEEGKEAAQNPYRLGADEGIREEEGSQAAQGDAPDALRCPTCGQVHDTDPEEVAYPDVEDARAVNEGVLEAMPETGNHLVMNEGLLDSALHRPQMHALYDEDADIFDLAARLAHGLVDNHAFENGNHRTAHILTHAFLEANGFGHCADEDDDDLARHIMGYTAHGQAKNGGEVHTPDETAAMLRERHARHVRGEAPDIKPYDKTRHKFHEGKLAANIGNIEEEIASYAAHAGLSDGKGAPYDSASLAEIYAPRVRQLIDLQNQGYTHAEWKGCQGCANHKTFENHWHGIDLKNAKLAADIKWCPNCTSSHNMQLGGDGGRYCWDCGESFDEKDSIPDPHFREEKTAANSTAEWLRRKEEALADIPPETLTTDPVWQDGNGWSVVPIKTFGDAAYEGRILKHCLGNPKHLHLLHRIEHETGVDYANPLPALTVPYLMSPAGQDERQIGANVMSLRDPNGIPKATWWEPNDVAQGTEVRDCGGYANTRIASKHERRIQNYVNAHGGGTLEHIGEFDDAQEYHKGPVVKVAHDLNWDPFGTHLHDPENPNKFIEVVSPGTERGQWNDPAWTQLHWGGHSNGFEKNCPLCIATYNLHQKGEHKGWLRNNNAKDICYWCRNSKQAHDDPERAAMERIMVDPKDDIELYEGMNPESSTDHVIERHNQFQTYPIDIHNSDSDTDLMRKHDALGPHEHLGKIAREVPASCPWCGSKAVEKNRWPMPDEGENQLVCQMCARRWDEPVAKDNCTQCGGQLKPVTVGEMKRLLVCENCGWMPKMAHVGTDGETVHHLTDFSDWEDNQEELENRNPANNVGPYFDGEVDQPIEQTKMSAAMSQCKKCKSIGRYGPFQKKCPKCGGELESKRKKMMAAYNPLNIQHTGEHAIFSEHPIPPGVTDWMTQNNMRLGIGSDETKDKSLFGMNDAHYKPGTREVIMWHHPEAKPGWINGALAHEVGHAIMTDERNDPDSHTEEEAWDAGRKWAGHVGLPLDKDSDTLQDMAISILHQDEPGYEEPKEEPKAEKDDHCGACGDTGDCPSCGGNLYNELGGVCDSCHGWNHCPYCNRSRGKIFSCAGCGGHGCEICDQTGDAPESEQLARDMELSENGEVRGGDGRMYRQAHLGTDNGMHHLLGLPHFNAPESPVEELPGLNDEIHEGDWPKSLVGRTGHNEVWYDPLCEGHRLPNGHLTITGESGSGKTQTMKTIIADLDDYGVNALVLDFKDDYSDKTYADKEGFRVYDPAHKALPLNPLVPPADPQTGEVSTTFHTYQLSEILGRIFRMGELQQHNLRQAMKSAYEEKGIPATKFVPGKDQVFPQFADLSRILAAPDAKGKTHNDELLGHLSPLFDFGLFDSDQPSTIAHLIDANTVVRLAQLPGNEVKNAVAEFFLMAMYNHLIQKPQSIGITNLLVLDEAWRVVHSPFLEPLLREGRAFGLAVLVATQFPSDLPLTVSGNAATQIYFSQSDPTEIGVIEANIVGGSRSPEADRVGEVIRTMQPLNFVLHNKQYDPYIQAKAIPYFARYQTAKTAADSHAEHLRKRDEILAEHPDKSKVVQKLDEGWSIKAVPPGLTKTNHSRSYEGNMMGNCVAQYSNDPETKVNIHSLRDPDNIPYISFEMDNRPAKNVRGDLICETCGKGHTRTDARGVVVPDKRIKHEFKGSTNLYLNQILGRNDDYPKEEHLRRMMKGVTTYARRTGAKNIIFSRGVPHTPDRVDELISGNDKNEPTHQYVTIPWHATPDQDKSYAGEQVTNWGDSPPESGRAFPTVQHMEYDPALHSVFKTPFTHRRFEWHDDEGGANRLYTSLKGSDPSVGHYEVKKMTDGTKAKFPTTTLEPVQLATQTSTLPEHVYLNIDPHGHNWNWGETEHVLQGNLHKDITKRDNYNNQVTHPTLGLEPEATGISFKIPSKHVSMAPDYYDKPWMKLKRNLKPGEAELVTNQHGYNSGTPRPYVAPSHVWVSTPVSARTDTNVFTPAGTEDKYGTVYPEHNLNFDSWGISTPYMGDTNTRPDLTYLHDREPTEFHPERDYFRVDTSKAPNLQLGVGNYSSTERAMGRIPFSAMETIHQGMSTPDHMRGLLKAGHLMSLFAHMGPDKAMHHGGGDELRKEHPYGDPCGACNEVGLDVSGKPCGECQGIGTAYDMEYWDSDEQLHDFPNYSAFLQIGVDPRGLNMHLDEHRGDKKGDAKFKNTPWGEHMNYHGKFNMVDKETAGLLGLNKAAHGEGSDHVHDPFTPDTFADLGTPGTGLRAAMPDCPTCLGRGHALDGTTCSTCQGWGKEIPPKAAAKTQTWWKNKRDEVLNTVGKDRSKHVYSFPDGWSIRKLQTAGDARFEGTLMRNCIREQGTISCEKCDETGNCRDCAGDGQTTCPIPHYDDGMELPNIDDCKKCHGSLYLNCKTCRASGRCQNCKGDGMIDAPPSYKLEDIQTGYTDREGKPTIHSLRDPDNIPKVSFCMAPEYHNRVRNGDMVPNNNWYMDEIHGLANATPDVKYSKRLVNFFKDFTKDKPGEHSIEGKSIEDWEHDNIHEVEPDATHPNCKHCQEGGRRCNWCNSLNTTNNYQNRPYCWDCDTWQDNGETLHGQFGNGVKYREMPERIAQSWDTADAYTRDPDHHIPPSNTGQKGKTDPWMNVGDSGELILKQPSGKDVRKWVKHRTFPGDKPFADHPTNQDHVDMGQVVGGWKNADISGDTTSPITENPTPNFLPSMGAPRIKKDPWTDLGDTGNPEHNPDLEWDPDIGRWMNKSRVGAMSNKEYIEKAKETRRQMKIWGGPYTDRSKAVHKFDDGWTIKRLNTFGDLRYEGNMMGNCIAGVAENPCDDCGGDGQCHEAVRVPDPEDPFNRRYEHPEKCESCNGTRICSACKGAGSTPLRNLPGGRIPRNAINNTKYPVNDYTSLGETGALNTHIYSLRDPNNIPKVSFYFGEDDYDPVKGQPRLVKPTPTTTHMTKCWDCEGSGFHRRDPLKVCNTCDGLGEAEETTGGHNLTLDIKSIYGRDNQSPQLGHARRIVEYGKALSDKAGGQNVSFGWGRAYGRGTTYSPEHMDKIINGDQALDRINGKLLVIHDERPNFPDNPSNHLLGATNHRDVRAMLEHMDAHEGIASHSGRRFSYDQFRRKGITVHLIHPKDLGNRVKYNFMDSDHEVNLNGLNKALLNKTKVDMRKAAPPSSMQLNQPQEPEENTQKVAWKWVDELTLCDGCGHGPHSKQCRDSVEGPTGLEWCQCGTRSKEPFNYLNPHLRDRVTTDTGYKLAMDLSWGGYDPVRDVSPTTQSAPAPRAQGSGSDPWVDLGDNGTAPPRPGLTFDKKLKKWIKDNQMTWPEENGPFPGAGSDVNKMGTKDWPEPDDEDYDLSSHRYHDEPDIDCSKCMQEVSTTGPNFVVRPPEVPYRGPKGPRGNGPRGRTGQSGGGQEVGQWQADNGIDDPVKDSLKDPKADKLLPAGQLGWPSTNDNLNVSIDNQNKIGAASNAELRQQRDQVLTGIGGNRSHSPYPNRESYQDQAETVHKFNDGWTVKKLKTWGDLDYEGNMMNHCVSQEHEAANEGEECPDCEGYGSCGHCEDGYEPCERCTEFSNGNCRLGSGVDADTHQLNHWKDYQYTATSEGMEPCDRCRMTGEQECRMCYGKGHRLTDSSETCGSCSGSGKETCTDCHGLGEVHCQDCEGRGVESCGECFGSANCQHCNGTGRITTDENPLGNYDTYDPDDLKGPAGATGHYYSLRNPDNIPHVTWYHEHNDPSRIPQCLGRSDHTPTVNYQKKVLEFAKKNLPEDDPEKGFLHSLKINFGQGTKQFSHDDLDKIVHDKMRPEGPVLIARGRGRGWNGVHEGAEEEFTTPMDVDDAGRMATAMLHGGQNLTMTLHNKNKTTGKAFGAMPTELLSVDSPGGVVPQADFHALTGEQLGNRVQYEPANNRFSYSLSNLPPRLLDETKVHLPTYLRGTQPDWKKEELCGECLKNGRMISISPTDGSPENVQAAFDQHTKYMRHYFEPASNHLDPKVKAWLYPEQHQTLLNQPEEPQGEEKVAHETGIDGLEDPFPHEHCDWCGGSGMNTRSMRMMQDKYEGRDVKPTEVCGKCGGSGIAHPKFTSTEELFSHIAKDHAKWGHPNEQTAREAGTPYGIYDLHKDLHADMGQTLGDVFAKVAQTQEQVSDLDLHLYKDHGFPPELFEPGNYSHTELGGLHMQDHQERVHTHLPERLIVAEKRPQ